MDFGFSIFDSFGIANNPFILARTHGSSAGHTQIQNREFKIQNPAAVPKSKIENPKSKISSATWSRVRLFAMDVDGVLTDGRILVSSDGTESKFFSILDGLGLNLVQRAGIAVALISGRPSAATATRAHELGIPHVIQGRTDKAVALQELARKLGLGPEACAYMGDDVIDVPALAWAGVGIAPPGAMPVAIAAADLVTQREAGHGAVREVCDLLVASRTAKGSGSKKPERRSHPS